MIDINRVESKTLYCCFEKPQITSKKMSSVKNTIVAAIDFGTTYSGYVFSLGIDQTKFYFPQKWAAGHGEQIFFKTPTSLLLNPDQTFNSFGYEAEDKFAELAFEQKQAEFYHFKNFKMDVYLKVGD